MPKTEDNKPDVKPKDVLAVVHENDRAIIEARDIYPEGVLILDDATYVKVARLGEFFNPDSEASTYRPPLNIAALSGQAKENVLKVLGGKG
jgi:hypothetical protein